VAAGRYARRHSSHSKAPPWRFQRPRTSSIYTTKSSQLNWPSSRPASVWNNRPPIQAAHVEVNSQTERWGGVEDCKTSRLTPLGSFAEHVVGKFSPQRQLSGYPETSRNHTQRSVRPIGHDPSDRHSQSIDTDQVLLRLSAWRAPALFYSSRG